MFYMTQFLFQGWDDQSKYPVAWLSHHFTGIEAWEKAKEKGKDFALLSLSDHAILSLGTFGLMSTAFSLFPSVAVSKRTR